RRAVEADIGRERRLHPGLALLAFEAFEECRLLAADIGPCSMVEIKIEVPAMDIVLANKTRFIGLIDCRLKVLALANELASYVDIADMSAHGGTREQATLDEKMRIVPHDVAVLAGARLRFIGIDDKIVRPVAD